jgi:Tfp pilus assembly protein PilF
MALAFAEKGDYESAMKQLLKALKKDPFYADTYIVKGQINAGLGNIGESIDDFVQVLTVSPVNALIRR